VEPLARVDADLVEPAPAAERASAPFLAAVLAGWLLMPSGPAAGLAQPPPTPEVAPAPPAQVAGPPPADSAPPPATRGEGAEAGGEDAQPGSEEAAAGEETPALRPIDEECALPPSGDWLDNLRRGVYRSVCGTSLWFDHFFGAKRIENERHDTYGWFGSTISWDEVDGVEPKVRLRAKFALPRLSSRLNAVVGREDRDTFLGDDPQDQRVIPDPFLDTDEEWLTGLEYRGVHGDRHDLDYGVGVDLGFPMDPYVRIRYRFQDFLTDHWFFRFRLTPFWSNSEKAGSSTRIELDRAIHDGLLFRLGGSAMASRRSEGVEWSGGPILYHRLSDRRAIAWRFVAWGESDSDVPLEGYGPDVTYRQRVWKEWLYLELELRVAARREEPEAPRDWVPRVGFGFEMRFGEPER
jgi:hypothetical protein